MTHAHIGVVAGALSFKEIARAWSKAAGDSPEMLMDALVRDFWLGKFESDGHSALFVMSKPASPTWAPSTLQLHASRIGPIGFVERRPGDYAIRDGGEVVKVAEDGESYPTHERTEVLISREDVAYGPCWPDWRVIAARQPTEFRGWTDNQRDDNCPNWRKDFENGYFALSMRPFNQWSSHMRDDHYATWQIRRYHFADWYRSSPLSTGAPIKQFWPESAAKKLTVFPTPPATAKAREDCRRLLHKIMLASPDKRTRTKADLRAEASTNIGRLSGRGFDQAWKQAAEDAKAYAWLRGGAPKKSQQ